ncbi:Uncharacterized protein YR821_p20017 (plasmid) [Yersinia ruckeri]|nr:hypothetical protein yruck0001_31150 [Yersinia ruckeri ATCC 29473]QTD78476.1 Uncharacterized protein YR821_p20017 [Yersinia ruckeri]
MTIRKFAIDILSIFSRVTSLGFWRFHPEIKEKYQYKTIN